MSEAAAASAPGVERHLVAMTQDPALAAALQELAATGVTVQTVEDLRAFADLLMEHEAALALLDTQALGVPADAAVDAVKNQFPDVRLLVAGHTADQNLLAARIADQKVFRFVHKPASAQRLRLFVDAAQGAASTPASAAAPTTAAAPPSGTGSSMLPIIGGLAGVLALAIGGWFLMREDGAAPAAATATTPAPQPVAPEVVALLARADEALAAGRHVAADGSSAAELYREVLRSDASNAAATSGFEQSIERALGGAEQSLLEGELEAARLTAEMVRLIEPDNSRLDFLHTQIERELERINADATQRRTLEAKQAQIRTAVAAVEQRIARGALIEPADNAVSRFREAQNVGGGDPLVRTARDSLVGALLTAADRELSADRPTAARRLVDAAGSVNSSAPGLDFARRRIDEALIQQAALSTAPAPVASPPAAPAVAAPAASTPTRSAATPAPGAAVPAPAARTQGQPTGDSVVSATALRIERRVAPDYPQQALQNLVSGWVEMEFTVATDGSVKDVIVIGSEPRRVFDSAATAAMRRYRYEPVIRDGEPVEQRARLRMRFTAQDTSR